MVETIFDFTLTTLQGDALPLSRFRGQPIVVVNTASRCAFTTQYEGLQALWSQRRERGLVVIGVPSNDFGNQEPGGGAEIEGFCSRNYGVGFPMTEKSRVRGRDAHPLFHWLAREGGALSRPRWNFFKYVVGRDGRLASWFTPLASPDSVRFRTAVDRAILDR